MVKNAKNVRRNHKKVISGNLFQDTTLGGTYETRNLGTKHRPHWVIDDDEGNTIWVSKRSYRELFRPIFEETPVDVQDKPDLTEGELAYLWQS